VSVANREATVDFERTVRNAMLERESTGSGAPFAGSEIEELARVSGKQIRVVRFRTTPL
jgi:hypothetical protein